MANPTIYGPINVVTPDTLYVDALVKAGICPSKREARHLASQGALYDSESGWPRPIADWKKITDVDQPIGEHDGWFLLSRGKQWSLGHLTCFIVG